MIAKKKSRKNKLSVAGLELMLQNHIDAYCTNASFVGKRLSDLERGLELRMENIEAAQESLRASHCVARDEMKHESERRDFLANCKGKDFDSLALRVKILEGTKYSDAFVRRVEDLEQKHNELITRVSSNCVHRADLVSIRERLDVIEKALQLQKQYKEAPPMADFGSPAWRCDSPFTKFNSVRREVEELRRRICALYQFMQ